MRVRRLWLVVGLGLVMAGSGSSLTAQEPDEAVLERLRAAARLEAAGELADAESLLLGLLDEEAAFVPALLALERVLRVQGRTDELVPRVEEAADADPRSALLNRLRLRLYSALDRTAELERSVDEWTAAVPGVEIPYREAARTWGDRGEWGRARDVLEAGRRRLGRPVALALPLAEVYAALGDRERVVEEWDRAIDAGGRGVTEVQRRARRVPDRRPLIRALVERLAAEGATPGRLGAALELALDAGLAEEARGAAEGLLPAVALDERRRLLEDVARRAEAVGAMELAFWAYGGLLEVMERQRYAAAGTPEAGDGAVEIGRLVAVRNRLAELALAMGDTAAAATGYRAVEEAFAEGSPQRRAAGALRIELLAARDVDGAVEALTRFRADHAGTPELDRAASTVAGALDRAGRADQAEAVLDSVTGPRSTVLRARLLLERGAVPAARTEYLRAAPELRGAEATRVLGLATLLGRLSVPAASRVGEALRLRDADRDGEAVDRLLADPEGLAPGDLPPLLDFAAGLADDAGLTDDARRIRRRIVADHPRSLEAPAALLALGREPGGEPEARAEAREHLERLIIEYPTSALAPRARRALERLRAGGAT